MIRRPPRSTLFPTRRSSDLQRTRLGGRQARHGEACRKRMEREKNNAQNLRKKGARSEEHTSELQSLTNLVCRLLLEKKKYKRHAQNHTQTPQKATENIEPDE